MFLLLPWLNWATGFHQEADRIMRPKENNIKQTTTSKKSEKERKTKKKTKRKEEKTKEKERKRRKYTGKAFESLGEQGVTAYDAARGIRFQCVAYY